MYICIYISYYAFIYIYELYECIIWSKIKISAKTERKSLWANLFWFPSQTQQAYPPSISSYPCTSIFSWYISCYTALTYALRPCSPSCQPRWEHSEGRVLLLLACIPSMEYGPWRVVDSQNAEVEVGKERSATTFVILATCKGESSGAVM